MKDMIQKDAFQYEPDIQSFLVGMRNNIEGKPDELIGLLQEAQAEFGFLPDPILLEISRLTGQSPANVYGVATFYAQFRFQPVGKHIIRLCCGTACHVKGSDRMLDDLMEYLQVAPGETTKDGLFTLETVACFGSCALAPVLVMDEIVHGSMNRLKMIRLIDDIRAQEPELDSKKISTEG